MAPFVLKSIRERRLSQGLMVFAAVAILATLDPIANWVSYTIYDPRLLHFPTTWTWMRFSPSVEPILVVPGYPFYYFSIALIAFGFGQRVLLPEAAGGLVVPPPSPLVPVLRRLRHGRSCGTSRPSC